MRIEHLESLERHWNSTFNAFDAAIAVFDKMGHLIRVNKRFEDDFSSDIISQEPHILKLETYKFSYKNCDFESHQFPYTDGNIVIIRDITESQKLERQILESSKMAELGMIGSSIAHEINNPLAGMLSYIQLIKMDMPPSHTCYNDILEMEAATLRCKNIVENLLGFARKSDLENFKKIDITSVIKESMDLISLSAKYKGIKIIFTPNTEETFWVSGNSNNLVQAFRNILQNSLEAISQENKGLIKINIQKEDEKISVSIEDNGVGIDPDIQNKIFNPLFTTKNHDQNPGLGLTVAFQIFQDHNANLEFFSQPKVGTSAKVSFKRLDLRS